MAVTQTTQQRLTDIIASELGVDELEVIPAARFVEDLGADSLDCIEIVIVLEDEFSIEIPDEAVEKFVTVKDLFDYVERKVKVKR